MTGKISSFLSAFLLNLISCPDEAILYNQAMVPSSAETENVSLDEAFIYNQETVPSFAETKNVSPDEAFMYNQATVPSFAEMENVNAQGEMGTLMSEVSRQFTHCKDYSFNYILGEHLCRTLRQIKI